MTTSDSGSWGQPWTAEEIRQLREYVGLPLAGFADRLGVHKRTIERWEKGETTCIEHSIIERLDHLLCEVVLAVAVWLTHHQVRQMHRRNALALLTTSAGAFFPFGETPWVWNDKLRRGEDHTLDHLEAVSAGFAGMYAAVPSVALIGPVAAHLEDATRLLNLSMSPGQRQRLQTRIAEITLLVGRLATNAHRPAQASAHYQLAEQHAREAENHALLAAALTEQSHLHSTINSGVRQPSSEAIKRLEQAHFLASKHAPAITQAWTAARLAEERACAHEVTGTEKAFERAQRMLGVAEREALPVSCSTAHYSTLHTEGLDGFRGICDILLRRPERATEVLTNALEHSRTPRRQTIILADLGTALIGQGELPEGSARLIQAHTLCTEHDYLEGLRRIYGVRNQFPQHCAGLACIQELDERLRLRVS
jgi:transcriptional regulator with XRE-family HTH domain